jgi:hypothetical protein
LILNVKTSSYTIKVLVMGLIKNGVVYAEKRSKKGVDAHLYKGVTHVI